MSVSTARRPLPALAFLLVLSVLTAIVWWRVLHRPDASSSTAPPSHSAAPLTCAPGKAVRLPPARSVLVVVLNGANRDQLATQVSTQLKARGFRTGTPEQRAEHHARSRRDPVQQRRPGQRHAAQLLRTRRPAGRGQQSRCHRHSGAGHRFQVAGGPDHRQQGRRQGQEALLSRHAGSQPLASQPTPAPSSSSSAKNSAATAGWAAATSAEPAGRPASPDVAAPASCAISRPAA